MNEERIHVLIVDDEESLRVPLQKILSSEPFYYQVDIAANGAEAMDLMRAANGQYDVTIIDQALMPGPNGIQVMCNIHERFPDVECIIFTGWGEDDSRKAIEAGAFRHLSKNYYGYEELAMLIRTAAHQVRLRLISRSILLQHDLALVLEEIARAARSLALADQAAIVLPEPQSNELRRYPDTIRWHGHYINKEISRAMICTGKVTVVHDLEREKDVDPALLASGMRSFVGVPIPYKEDFIGVLYVYSKNPNYFNAWGTISLLQTLAGQASLAITNARSFQQIRKHAGYMEALVRAGQGFSEANSEEELLTHAWGFLKEHLQVSSFFLALHDSNRNLLRFPIAFDNDQPLKIPDRPLDLEGVDIGIAGHVFKTGCERVWLSRQQEEEMYSQLGVRSIHAGSPPYPESCFHSPLKVSDGILGVISIQSDRPNAYSSVQLDAFRAFSSQMAVALDKARLFEDLRRSSEHLASLNEVVLEISKEQSQDSLLQKVIDKAIDLIEAQGGGIYLLDPSSQWLDLRASRGLPEVPPSMRIHADEGLSGVILRTGKAFSLPNYAAWECRIKRYDNEPITSVAGVPIRFGDRILGTLVVHHTLPDCVFDSNSISLLQHFANHTGLAIEKINLMDTLRVIQGVSTNLVSATEYQEVLNRTCRSAVELFGVEHSGLVLFDANLKAGLVEGEYPAYFKTLHQRIPLDNSGTERLLVESQSTIVYHDIYQHEKELGEILPILAKNDIRSIVMVPIVYQGRVLGSFSLDAVGHTRKFFDEEVELCKVFAASVAVAVENARLIRTTRQGQEYVKSLFEATSAIISRTNNSDVMKSIVEAACRATGAWRAVAILVDESAFPKALAQIGFANDLTISSAIREYGISRQVVQTRQPVFFSDLLLNKDVVHPRMIAQGSRAAACLPLALSDQTPVIGVLWVQFKEPHPFSEIEKNSLQIFASQAAMSIENSRLYLDALRRQKLLSSLDQASREMRAEKEPARLRQEIVRLAAELVECADGCLMVSTKTQGQLKVDEVFGLPETFQGQNLSCDPNLLSQLFTTGTACNLPGQSPEDFSQAMLHFFQLDQATIVPMDAGNEMNYLLLVGGPFSHQPTDMLGLEILTRFALQATLALQTSRAMQHEQRMVSQLSILHQVSDTIQSADALEDIVNVMLTGVTAGYGLGFNRAALLMYDIENDLLIGSAGIGYLNKKEAEIDWSKHHKRGLESFPRFLELMRSRHLPKTPVGRNIERLTLQLQHPGCETLRGLLNSQECTILTEEEVLRLPGPFLTAFKPAVPLLAAPLRIHDQVIGLLLVDNKFTSTEITEEEKKAVLTFVNTASIAIEKNRLFHETDHSRMLLSSFYQSSNALIFTKDLDAVLHEIVDRARQNSEADTVHLILIDHTGWVARHATSGRRQRMASEESVYHHELTLEVMRSKHHLLLTEAAIRDTQLNERPFWKKVHSALCLPVQLETETIGVMWFYFDQRHSFSTLEIDALQLYINQAGLVYDSIRRIKELEHMRQAAEALAGAASLPEVLEQIVNSACAVLQADSTAIWSYDDVRDKFNPESSVAAGIPNELWQVFRKEEPRRGRTAYWVMKEGWVGVNDITDLTTYSFLGKSTISLLQKVGVKSFQGIVLKVGDEKMGVLYVNYKHLRSFSENEREIVRTFANQAALALKKAHLLEQVSIARNAAKVVSEVSVLEDLHGTLNSIVQGSKEALNADAVLLFVYNPDRSEFDLPTMAGVRNEAAIKHLRGITKQSVVWNILALDHIHKAEKVADDKLMNRGFVSREDIKSAAGVPLQVGDRKVGVMFINYRSFHRFTNDEEINIGLFANQAAVAIRNAQLYGAKQLFQQSLLAIQETSATLSRERNLEIMLPVITKKAADIFNADAASLMLWDDEENPNKMVIRSAVKLSEEYQEQQSIRKEVVDRLRQEHNEGPYVFNVRDHPLGKADLVNLEALANVLVSALMVDNELIGILNIYARNQPRKFNEHEKDLARIFANHAAIAIKNARAYETLERTKGIIGARTALAWMSMTSNIWQHSITGSAETILEEVDLCFRQGEVPAEGKLHEHLEKISRLSMQIVEQRRKMNLPTSQEENVRSIHLNELVEERAQQLMEPLDDEEIPVKLKMKLDLSEQVTVRVSSEWLRRAFDIVINNAVQATEHQRERCITIRTREKRGSAQIVIQDNGPGIRPDLLDKIFVEKIDKAPGEKGSGIGLLMAQVIVQTYGGNIWVEASGPNGATMVISLPIERYQEDRRRE